MALQSYLGANVCNVAISLNITQTPVTMAASW